MRRFLLALLPAVGIAVEVEAAKLATPDAMPVDQGRIEIALGVSWARSSSSLDHAGDRQDRGGTLVERTAEAGATFGIREDLDAGITLGWSRIDDDAADPDSGSGPTDIALGAKWRFLAHDAAALALLPEISLPVGDGRPEDRISSGTEDWGFGLTLASTVVLERLALGAAIGRGWVINDAEERGAWAIDLAVGWQLTDMVQPEIELHHAREEVAGDASRTCQTCITLGLQFSCQAGRLGFGLDQVVAGRDSDRTTTLLAQAVTSF